VPAREVVLAKSCKGRVLKNPVKSEQDVDFSKDYVNPDSMAQVRVAKARIDLGMGFTSGMKVSFLVTNANQRPMQVAPWLDDMDGSSAPSYDGQFYAERLASALGRITEVFDWDAKDLLTGNKQTTLFSF